MSPSPSSVLLQGTVDLLVLRVLEDNLLHGYGIAAAVHERTDGVLTLEDGALYQSVHRLSRKELIEGEWGRSENNRRAKFYRLTEKGRKHLESEGSAWRTYAQAVFGVLDPGEASA